MQKVKLELVELFSKSFKVRDDSYATIAALQCVID